MWYTLAFIIWASCQQKFSFGGGGGGGCSRLFEWKDEEEEEKISNSGPRRRF